jgi:hypothetical protein
VTRHLAAGRVLRVDARQRVSRLSVVEGCLWLTTTPAEGDVILGTGDEWHADGRWPVVVQAVGRTAVTVFVEVHGSKFEGLKRALT